MSFLEEIPTLKLTFDLRVHTASSLEAALKRKREEDPTKRRKFAPGELPSQTAGRRPTTKPEDGPSASRHRLITQPATLVLIFNCNGAAFEVTNWTGDTPFEKLSGENAFDLISPKSKKRIGRVGLAKELGMPFLERVEFPDDWLLANEHGVVHDGWQKEGVLDLELQWGKEVATIRCFPWLGYACSVGAPWPL